MLDSLTFNVLNNLRPFLNRCQQFAVWFGEACKAAVANYAVVVFPAWWLYDYLKKYLEKYLDKKMNYHFSEFLPNYVSIKIWLVTASEAWDESDEMISTWFGKDTREAISWKTAVLILGLFDTMLIVLQLLVVGSIMTSIYLLFKKFGIIHVHGSTTHKIACFIITIFISSRTLELAEESYGVGKQLPLTHGTNTVEITMQGNFTEFNINDVKKNKVTKAIQSSIVASVKHQSSEASVISKNQVSIIAKQDRNYLRPEIIINIRDSIVTEKWRNRKDIKPTAAMIESTKKALTKEIRAHICQNMEHALLKEFDRVPWKINILKVASLRGLLYQHPSRIFLCRLLMLCRSLCSSKRNAKR